MSDARDVSHLPQGPDLPCEDLWRASVVEQDSRLILTEGVCGSLPGSCVDPGYQGQ